MANPNVSGTVEAADEQKNPFEGKINSSVENPFTGKKEDITGTFSLPLAVDWDSLQGISKGDETDILFWYNFGRKVAARQQLNARLEFDLGSDKLNDLYNSFKNAMKNMGIDENSPQAKRDRVKNFILSEDNFEPLRAALDNWKPGNVHIDFAAEELRKPTGKRGRRAKSDGSEAGNESSE